MGEGGGGGPDGAGGGCRYRPWVPDRGGGDTHTSRAKRAGCLGNPRRPGHSSHATGRILKAPVPSPGSPPPSTLPVPIAALAAGTRFSPPAPAPPPGWPR